MSTKILLTIAIPTFNRSEELRKQFQRLQHELLLVDKPSIVEVLVADNGSTDSTAVVIDNYKKLFKNFNSYTHRTNIGFDKNVIFLYQHSKGKYIWFLSDDDAFTDNSLKIILEQLTKNSAGIIPLLQHTKMGNNLINKPLIDLIPYEPVNITVGINIGKISELKKSDQKERLAVILLCSQFSSTILKKMRNLPKISDAGGLMHCYLANQTLLHFGNYFIPKRTLILPGPKKSISKWFMTSVLFGTRKLYSRVDMKFTQEIVDIISIQTAIFGLKLLAQRYYYPSNFFSFPTFSTEHILSLKRLFGRSYSKIHQEVDNVLESQTLKNRIKATLSATFLYRTCALCLMNIRDAIR